MPLVVGVGVVVAIDGGDCRNDDGVENDNDDDDDDHAVINEGGSRTSD
jgi:hypothetical protein